MTFVVSVITIIFFSGRLNKKSKQEYDKKIEKLNSEKIKNETIINNTDYDDYNNDGTLKPGKLKPRRKN